jgi:hypothetical protein
MSVRSLAAIAALTLTSVTLVAARAPAGLAHDAGMFGPPWISIETPVNPYDATTRGAFLVVHTFHHGTQLDAPLSGTAEGIMNGERRSIPLQFTSTTRPGAYALRKQWSDGGVWTLNILATQHENDVAQALVEIAPSGQVVRVEVPTRLDPRYGNQPLPRQVSAQEVDSALRMRARLALAKN